MTTINTLLYAALRLIRSLLILTILNIAFNFKIAENVKMPSVGFEPTTSGSHDQRLND